MERRRGSAELEDSQQSNRKGPTIGQQRGDPISRTRPLPGEKMGKARSSLVELGPGKLTAVPQEGRLRSQTPRVIFKETDKIFCAWFGQKNLRLLRHGAVLLSSASTGVTVKKYSPQRRRGFVRDDILIRFSLSVLSADCLAGAIGTRFIAATACRKTTGAFYCRQAC